MLGWKQIRFGLLVVVSGAALVVFVKTALYPNQPKSNFAAYDFPQTVPLTGWQALDSHSLSNPIPEQTNYRSGRQYRYTQQHVSLDIEIRYIVGTDGDIKAFIAQYIKPSKPLNQLNWMMRQEEGVGSYALFIDQGKAYLSSCINPYGGSTVTDREFKYNRNFHDIRHRLIPWLLGESLKDERCLWTIASTSLQNASSESSYSLLEKTWFEWNEWWHLHFPET
jgi:cyanosortase A-associated protein